MRGKSCRIHKSSKDSGRLLDQFLHFPLVKDDGDIFRTSPISHTPGPTAPPGSVISHAPSSRFNIASEGFSVSETYAHPAVLLKC